MNDPENFWLDSDLAGSNRNITWWRSKDQRKRKTTALKAAAQHSIQSTQDNAAPTPMMNYEETRQGWHHGGSPNEPPVTRHRIPPGPVTAASTSQPEAFIVSLFFLPVYWKQEVGLNTQKHVCLTCMCRGVQDWTRPWQLHPTPMHLNHHKPCIRASGGSKKCSAATMLQKSALAVMYLFKNPLWLLRQNYDCHEFKESVLCVWKMFNMFFLWKMLHMC